MTITLTANDLMADLSTPETDALIAEKVAADKAKEEAALEAYYYPFGQDDEDYDCYEPDYYPVGGHGREDEIHYNDPRLGDVEVVYAADLIETLYPGYYDKGLYQTISYEQTGKDIMAWADENDAHIFSWGGPSYGSQAMLMVGLCNAVANGKSKLIVDALS